MAVSISTSTSTYPLLKPERSISRFSDGSSRLLSSSFLQLPVRVSRAQVRNNGVYAPSRSRIFPVVKARKQTFSSFDDLLAGSDKPVLVDFYATWCGPCQFMVPVLDEVSTKLKDTIRVVKIDTEKYPTIASKYTIEALPTFILFKDGKQHDRFEGALTAEQLIQRIEDSLKVKQ